MATRRRDHGARNALRAELIAFTVYGDPMPKGSKTAVVRGARAVLLDGRRGPARAKYALWKTAIAAVARQQVAQLPALLDGAIGMTVVFHLRRPKSQTRAQRAVVWHTTRPDVDKLLRAVLDPLTGVIIADDARIAYVIASKRFALADEPTRAEITITCLQEGAKACPAEHYAV